MVAHAFPYPRAPRIPRSRRLPVLRPCDALSQSMRPRRTVPVAVSGTSETVTSRPADSPQSRRRLLRVVAAVPSTQSPDALLAGEPISDPGPGPPHEQGGNRATARHATLARQGRTALARQGHPSPERPRRTRPLHPNHPSPVRPGRASLVRPSPVRPGRASVAGSRGRLRGVARARHAVRSLRIADLPDVSWRRLFGRLRMVRPPPGPARPARRPPEHACGPRHPSRDGPFPAPRAGHDEGARAGVAPRPRRTGPGPLPGPDRRTELRRTGSTPCAARSTQRHHRRQRLTSPRTARAQRSARCPSSCRGAVSCLRPHPARPCGVPCSHSR